MNLDDSKLFINRELSWLEFNYRVLEEAGDQTNPILERFKFLAITASNLDEFFMVRVSGLMEQVFAGTTKKDPSGLTCEQQLSEISKATHKLVNDQYTCLNNSLMPILKEKGLGFVSYNQLNKNQKDFVKEYFDTTLFPIITPMAIDISRPFPLLLSKSLNIIVELKDEKDMFAVVQIPSVINRVLELPFCESNIRQFIFIEDIIKHYIHKLFQGYTVISAYCFRITRNADLDIDEDDDCHDLLIEIEEQIKMRKRGQPVRLEVESNISQSSFNYLVQQLKILEEDIYSINGILDLTVCFSIADIKKCSELCDKPMTPQIVPEFVNKNIFDAIKEKDILLHHPYESFEPVINFIKISANDPDVLAIKQTLYRVSGNSPIINALIQAAENGKQVTVLVELKARFDEENNINWARKLEKAGCHVIYGLVGLKTHCKLCLVVRRENDGIHRYVHMGTGNYNDKTAKQYTDLGMFTSKESYGKDISLLFNRLSGYSKTSQWNKIAVAPTGLREMFLYNIDRETKNAKEGKPAKIIAKMNSLVDVEIIKALYKASMAGVKINLIVRGICCLKSGIKGISENIRVISIVDRFLEHSRIFYFENGGDYKIFLASSDWMPRNLDRRVEVAFTVEDDAIKEKLIKILDITLNDNVKARIQVADNIRYERVNNTSHKPCHAQQMFYDMAKKQANKIIKHDRKGFEDIFKPIYKK